MERIYDMKAVGARPVSPWRPGEKWRDRAMPAAAHFFRKASKTVCFAWSGRTTQDPLWSPIHNSSPLLKTAAVVKLNKQTMR